MHCPSQNGCPTGFPVKCDKSGTCAANNNECITIYANTLLPNKCKIDNPVLCDNQICVA